MLALVKAKVWLHKMHQIDKLSTLQMLTAQHYIASDCFIWSGVSAISKVRPQNSFSAVALSNPQGRVLTSGKDNALILQTDIDGVIGAKGLTKGKTD